ncbi:MAG: M4 family metallopeptidase [Deltaproteobacteria bacterium]|nr:M4 family metallopeptidase [Deltaproteobacteria bacterium]
MIWAFIVFLSLIFGAGTGPASGPAGSVSARSKTLPTLYKAAVDEAPAIVAIKYLGEYKDSFGMKDPETELTPIEEKTDRLGFRQMKYRQIYQGVPVLGAQLRVGLNEANELKSIGGRFAPGLSVDVTPKLSSDEAGKILKRLLMKERPFVRLDLKEPTLKILDRSLFNRKIVGVHLVWEIPIKGVVKNKPALYEKIYLDAHTGSIVFRYPYVARAFSADVYDANSAWLLPGDLVITGDFTAGADAEADLAYGYAKEAYQYFFDKHGLDGWDNNGAKLGVTVHYDDGYRAWSGAAGCGNSYALGSENMLVFCENMVARDVLGHEYTHGVTYNSSNLFLAYEPGALNESYSDIFGSSLDGNWSIGEEADYPTPSRDMADPTAYGQPDRVSSSLFSCENALSAETDYGGIHINSGVPNKAAYLMAEGGSFNGVTVTGIGREKMEAIHYRALTTKLIEVSNFQDDYEALVASCEELIGTGSIADADCAEVESALKAVEMDTEPCVSTSGEAESGGTTITGASEPGDEVEDSPVDVGDDGTAGGGTSGSGASAGGSSSNGGGCSLGR